MSPRGSLKPLTLLLLSLLCYGFVMVWTEKTTLETPINLKNPSTTLSPALVNVLTGRNLSVSVPPSHGSSQPTSAGPQLSPTTEGTSRGDPALTTAGATSPMPTTGSSSSTGSTETPVSATAARDETSTGHPQSTAAGITSENLEGTSAVTTDDPDTTTTDTGLTIEGESPAITKPVKRNASTAQHDGGGRMAVRVRLQSANTKEHAIKFFFEKICDIIGMIPHTRDLVIIPGPHSAGINCLEKMSG